MARKKKKPSSDNTIARNKKARFDYHIEKTFEAGIALEGWEVKSARDKRVQLKESYVIVKHGEIWLLGSHISPLTSASTHINPDPVRTRKLLLHRREIDMLIGQVERKGYTLVPLSMYWSHGKVKLQIGLAKGKKSHDKRASIKERDTNRDLRRMMKQR